MLIGNATLKCLLYIITKFSHFLAHFFGDEGRVKFGVSKKNVWRSLVNDKRKQYSIFH